MATDDPAIEPHTGKRTEFPRRIGKTARRALAEHGYTRYEELTETTPKELLEIHGMGKRGIEILREELAHRDMSFADDS
jgi:predicted flap endonuclease-1-like 5' DNA nuclease